jgi:hypothetical protein
MITKDMLKSIKFMKKKKFTIKKHSKRPGHDKSHVFALYGTSPHVYNEKESIYKLILGFQRYQVGQVRSSVTTLQIINQKHPMYPFIDQITKGIQI